jgi:hypothetical protein
MFPEINNQALTNEIHWALEYFDKQANKESKQLYTIAECFVLRNLDGALWGTDDGKMFQVYIKPEDAYIVCATLGNDWKVIPVTIGTKKENLS